MSASNRGPICSEESLTAAAQNLRYKINSWVKRKGPVVLSLEDANAYVALFESAATEIRTNYEIFQDYKDEVAATHKLLDEADAWNEEHGAELADLRAWRVGAEASLVAKQDALECCPTEKRRGFVTRPPLKRGAPPKRKSWLKRGTKPIPKVNKAAARRKHAKYRAFMQSARWKAIREAALLLAGGRCQHTYAAVVNADTLRPVAGCGRKQCPETKRLTVHHLTYARFGGRELPTDLKVLCVTHHEAAEAEKGTVPLWRRV